MWTGFSWLKVKVTVKGYYQISGSVNGGKSLYERNGNCLLLGYGMNSYIT
jgi:hypothetical protein